MHKLLLTATALVLFASSPALADEKKGVWAIEPDPALPNVLILGDSISIGYTLQVRKALEGKANVFRPHTADGTKAENCSGTTKGVEAIDRWLGDRKWDVIHFNWGLHDLKHVTEPGGNKVSKAASDPVQATVEQYAQNLEQIVAKLKATDAKLIFATTTPVPAGTSGVLREPEAPPKYNAAAVKIMQANGIEVDDLFAFCQPRLAELQRPKNVHFTDKGSQELANQVSAAIEKALHEKSAK
ncbi:SGNH/GDSL hydrolase family protein [Blastopirellula marina]|uniref:SGNH/GDSL hydrolase family protein n=1 Tax=Blastopirellula marina TaxID=124 RepID=A0A2S8GE68_9BACT|nr:SGNH/GDSL hydrolase family protein [Blastopirellula marina]PQO42600.1 SGNH/GDSL hydrolase family protein [Blastopirellula marina]PTL46366.1 SGNH/GDSL hydrolase family protein [Blastopirellula marina]